MEFNSRYNESRHLSRSSTTSSTRRPHSRRSEHHYLYDDDTYGTSAMGSYRGYSQWQEHGSYSPRQLQANKQLYRSAQASKQMVIKVFENVIGALEELEKRELGLTKSSAGILNSPLYYADQSRHTNSDVKQQLETQLLLFETQIKSCSSEIRQEVRELLKEHTLRWNSVRSDMKMPHGPIDEYLAKLFQILAEGSTSHSSDFYRKPDIDDRELRKNYERITRGQHEADLLDLEFRDNPDKKARDPLLRGGSVSVGAERLASSHPSMDKYLRRYRQNRTDLR